MGEGSICCAPACTDKPQWVIQWEEPGRAHYDTYTHACDAHVGLLLQGEAINTVYPLED